MFTTLRKTKLPLSSPFTRFYSTISSPTSSVYRPRRALLYVPGSSHKMLAKASSLQADTICMDLEDAVADKEKPQARHNIVATLQSWQQSQPNPYERKERVVRINPVGSGFEQEDIDTLLNAPVVPDGILLPKVNHPDHVKWLHNEIEKKAKKKERLGIDKIAILALIESSKALLNLPAIAQSSERLDAFVFGGDDYAADVGATRTEKNKELLYARQYVVMVGKAFNLQCIDIVNIKFQNTDIMMKECDEGYHFGFTGKQIIHPKQIEIAHNCFAPHPDQVKWAKEIVEESERHAGQGVGAFSLNGHMIDMPTIKQAQNVLVRARACGVL